MQEIQDLSAQGDYRRAVLRRMCVPCHAPDGKVYGPAAIKSILEYETGYVSEWDTIVLLASVGIHPDRDGRYRLRSLALYGPFRRVAQRGPGWRVPQGAPAGVTYLMSGAVCQRLGISRSRLAVLTDAGRLRSVRSLGGGSRSPWLYDAADVDALVAGLWGQNL